MYVVILHNHQNLDEVQDGSVCVDDLEILIDHPCDLPSREEAFFCLRGFFLNDDTSFEVSVDDLLETPRCFRIRNLEICLQLGTGDSFRRFDVSRRATDFPDSISLIHTNCFNRTTCTRGYITPEISETSPSFELRFFAPLVLAPPHEHYNSVRMSGYLQDMQ